MDRGVGGGLRFFADISAKNRIHHVLHVVRTLHIMYCMLLYAVCCMLYGVCCMLYVVCLHVCMLYVVYCMFDGVWCTTNTKVLGIAYNGSEQQ
jgi:hypothetical protein